MTRSVRRVRRSRCIVLTIFFAALAFTTSASAECVWVLWTERERSDSTAWDYRDAFKTKEECWNLAAALNRNLEPRVSGKTQGKLMGILKGYHCFPDTVDPRGPKGK